MTPPRLNFQETDLLILTAITQCAEQGALCPSNKVLGKRLGMLESSVANGLKRLKCAGVIVAHIERHRRWFTICATGQSTKPPAFIHEPGVFSAGLHAGRQKEMSDAEIRQRADEDQARIRAQREAWLDIEREQYRLPKRGRLVDEMPA